MDTVPTPDDATSSREIAAEEQERLGREVDVRSSGGAELRHQRTLRALADVDAGRVIDHEVMRAWADSLGTDHELAQPD